MSSQPLVLVADDEQRITKLVSMALTDEGFRVVTAAGGEEALAKAEEVRPDIVLLDIVMPDLDGIEVMRQIRERRPVPVILLTARGSAAEKAKGLDQGADDYVAKPFHLDELAARVRAVLRRASGVTTGMGPVQFDDVVIDLERRIVTRDGKTVELSRTEWLLLQHLASNAGKVVLHTELLTKVWGPEYRDDLQYLRVWVSRVRRKLGAKPGEPGRIKTFQGIGYLLDVEPGRLGEVSDGHRSHDGEVADSLHRPAELRPVLRAPGSRQLHPGRTDHVLGRHRRQRVHHRHRRQRHALRRRRPGHHLQPGRERLPVQRSRRRRAVRRRRQRPPQRRRGQRHRYLHERPPPCPRLPLTGNHRGQTRLGASPTSRAS